MQQFIINLRRNGYATLVLTLGLVIGSGGFFTWLTYAKENARNASVNLVIDDTPITRTSQLTTSFSDVVKTITPSVVKINTSRKITRQMPSNPSFGRNPFFDRFFDQLPMPQMPDGQPRSGLGSGVIISDNGYILTNNHVVEDADEIRVTLNPDEREYSAELVGTDPKSDLAVLKIDAEGLAFAKIGDSENIEIGDFVLAIGNPFGVGQTVTMGIVSATGRASMGLDYEDFIQTDAAINPGNSGGALVDIEGRLIGINTAILSKTGANQGIGFAIPTNLARSVMEDLIEKGHVSRGYLGVAIQDVTPKIADYFDIDAKSGAIVADVTPDSPAENAGIQVGDVIVRVNDKNIRDSRQLKLAIGASDPYTVQDIGILRDHEPLTVEVKLTAAEGDNMKLSQRNQDADSEGALKGVAVQDLDRANRQQRQIPRRLTGVLVQDVDRNSASWRAGLRPGDVIREINRTPVEDADSAIALTQDLEPDVTLLRIWRRGGNLFLAVDESDLG